MKRVKISKIKLITLILTLLLAISINNVSYAATYSGLSGVSQLLAADPETVLRNNSTINLSFQDLKASSNLYCMERGQSNKSTGADYRILTYIEINGWSAKVWQRNDATGNADYQGERWSSKNAILAEILSGNYGDGGTGYGSGEGQYTSAQKGFYVYFKEWQPYVGVELGIDGSWVTCNDYVDDGSGAAVVTEATNKVNSEGSEATARIYLLDNAQWDSWQRLAVVEASASDTTDDEPENPDYDGYIKIRGKVWLDGEAGKANNINGTYGDSSDKGLGGITVKLLDSGGSEFKGGSHTTTNSDGSYEIVVNLDTNYHVYKLWEEPETVRNKLLYGAYVQFEYDGNLYTTVEASATGVKTSKATEDNGSRSSFDSKYTKVTPSSGDPDGIVTASTQSMFKFCDYTYKTTEKENPTIIYCYGQGKTVSYKDGDSDPTDRTYQLTNPDGEWLDVIYKYNQTAHNRNRVSHPESYDPPRYNIEYDEITGEETSRTEIFKDVFDRMEWCSGGHSVKRTSITNLKIENVNLGLFKREQPDIALTSDIDRVEVIMNNQKYTYKYKSQIGTPSYDDDNHFGTVKFQNKYIYTYRKAVNPADIGYINDPNSGADNETLKIYVTYKVTLSNQSTTLGVTVHKLVSDYDSEYTITSSGWGNASIKSGFKESVSNDLNIKLEHGETKSVEVTYSISPDAIRGLISHDSTLSNVFEIHTYSTQYGSSTLCAEEKTGSQWGRTGKAYAGRDTDSKPGNAGAYVATRNIKVDGSTRSEEVLDVKIGEDDTDIAPSFIIELAKEYKVMEGTVYEDTLADNCPDNERLGNGIKDSGELGVQNVRVELWDLDKGEDGEIATMYKVNRSSGTAEAIPAVVYTNEKGDFSFGDGTTFGVVVNNYCIKYVYGNDDIRGDGSNIATTINGDAINARNYKSTIVTQDPIKSIMQGKVVDNSEKWHLINGVDNTTTAVDNMDSRSIIDNTPLINGNFSQGFNVEADSVPFELQVEYTINPWAEVDKNGNGSFTNTWSTFDFGIIERPREDLVIDKTVTRLKLTLANGQIIIDGDPRDKDLDYTKAPGMKNLTAIDAKARNRLDKIITIEMDAEYIQGATLEVWYEITATNYSEKDYEYSTNQKYYYYGEGQDELPLIDTYVNYVLDYLDPELICTIDEENGVNTDWKTLAADDLLANGYISQETYNKVSSENYLIFGTSVFNNNLPTGTSRSTSLYASKLLGNQEEDLIYDNCTEIVEINGKVARTIDSVTDKTRKQVAKTYIPGDYTLSITDHQQDEDGVRITITPPTGLDSNVIIYIVTTAIALAVIGTGVYIIKKKVLK